MRAGLTLTGLLFLGGGVSLSAQEHAAPFVRWEPSVTSPELTESWRSSKGKSPGLGDYRYEGMAIGGIGFGALGVWVGSQISAGCPLEPGVPCQTDKAETAIALGLVGAAVGGGLGYLIGRFSPKRPSPTATDLPALELMTVPDSVRKRTGYQHWRGAALGLGLGGAVGALTGAVLGGVTGQCDDCSRQSTPGSGALALGLLGAGAGGVLGFLAGLSSPKYVWVPNGAQ